MSEITIKIVEIHTHHYTGTASGTTLLEKLRIHENETFDQNFFGNRKNTFKTCFKNCNMYGTCMLLVYENMHSFMYKIWIKIIYSDFFRREKYIIYLKL